MKVFITLIAALFLVACDKEEPAISVESGDSKVEIGAKDGVKVEADDNKVTIGG